MKLKRATKSLSLRINGNDMKTSNVISKELLTHLVMLEEKHQDKVLAYIKKLLRGEEIFTSDEEKAMHVRAERSERDIASGKVIKASKFNQDFEQWKKKKRASIKP